MIWFFVNSKPRIEPYLVLCHACNPRQTIVLGPSVRLFQLFCRLDFCNEVV